MDFIYFYDSLFTVVSLHQERCLLGQKSIKKKKSLSRVWLFATPWTVAHQAPLSMEFSRQEYWSGLPFPSAAAAAAAKSLQSCPTLCNPIDGSPPGATVPGILQARTLEWVAFYFSNAWKWKVKVKLLSRVQPLWPHGLQPTRLLCPWDFPGKSTRVGCHCLLVFVKYFLVNESPISFSCKVHSYWIDWI